MAVVREVRLFWSSNMRPQAFTPLVSHPTHPLTHPQGILQLGKNPRNTSSRDWKSFLFVLKHDAELKRSTLDYYKDGNKRWQKQEKKGSIVLWPYFQVSLAHECSYQFPIKITDPNKKEFYLAASSFEVMNKWCNSLQRQSYLVPSTKGINYAPYSIQNVEMFLCHNLVHLWLGLTKS
jgi:hypothetical protein